MEATREKKLDFIASLGPFALSDAVADMIRRKEAPWLTDEQVDDITSKLVDDVRFRQHLNIRNRRVGGVPMLEAAE